MTRMATGPRSYRLTPHAERALEDIWTYTVRVWSAKQSDEYHSDQLGANTALAHVTA